MFDGHIGIFELAVWVGGLLLIAIIDAVKEMRSRRQTVRGDGR